MSAPAEVDATSPSSSSGDEEVRLAVDFGMRGSPEAEGPSEAFPDGLPENEEPQGQGTRTVPEADSSLARSSTHRTVKPPRIMMQTASPIPRSLTGVSSISPNGSRESLSTPFDQDGAASTTWSTTPVTPLDEAILSLGPNLYPTLTGISNTDNNGGPDLSAKDDPDATIVVANSPDSSTPTATRRFASSSADALRDEDKVESWLKQAPMARSAEMSGEAGEGVLAKIKRLAKRSQASRKPTAPPAEVGRLFFWTANCCFG